MSEPWKTTTIGDCLANSFAGEWGSEPKPGNAIVFRATDIDDEARIVGGGALRRLPLSKLTAKRLRDGDIVLEGSGGGPDKPVGRVAYFDERAHVDPAVCSNFFKTLRPAHDRVDARFLLWKLAWFYKQAPILALQQQTTGIINLKVKEYLASCIEVPLTLMEQKTIAQILDTLDTAIHETEAIIAKLKAVKQGLLHDLLTRGIDANGELRPPQAEAPHLYKQSALGWIPKEWKEASARSLCSLITKGTTPAASKMWQGTGDVRFLRVDNLSFDGQLDFHASNFFVSHRTHRGELARSVCQSGDVMTNIVGPPLGKLGHVTEEVGDVNINQAIALFRPKPLVLSSFLLLWVGSSLAQTWFRGRAKQTSGQVNLTLALCQELPVPEVPMEEQQWICARLTSLDERLSLEINELGKLTQKKSGLMDDLLTGRVRVTPLLHPTPA